MSTLREAELEHLLRTHVAQGVSKSRADFAKARQALTTVLHIFRVPLEEQLRLSVLFGHVEAGLSEVEVAAKTQQCACSSHTCIEKAPSNVRTLRPAPVGVRLLPKGGGAA